MGEPRGATCGRLGPFGDVPSSEFCGAVFCLLVVLEGRSALLRCFSRSPLSLSLPAAQYGTSKPQQGRRPSAKVLDFNGFIHLGVFCPPPIHSLPA